jgi:hypothetical protein
MGYSYNENYENRGKGKASKYMGKIPYMVNRNILQMNDAHIDVYNAIFETLQELSTR